LVGNADLAAGDEAAAKFEVQAQAIIEVIASANLHSQAEP